MENLIRLMAIINADYNVTSSLMGNDDNKTLIIQKDNFIYMIDIKVKNVNHAPLYKVTKEYIEVFEECFRKELNFTKEYEGQYFKFIK